MKDYLNFILVGIKNLIERVREDLTPLIRGRIITIITIDVHGRDVVDMFVNKKIADSGHFAW
jgi:dynein heavy chain